MRSLLIPLLVVLLAAAIQAKLFKREKVTLGKKTCLCDFNIEIGDTCSGSVKCVKKCSGSGTVELGGCSFTLAVKKGKGKISKCSCEGATVPVPTEPTTGSGSGETPVTIPTTPGSGLGGPPPPGGEGMQCSCKCNCPDGSGECDCDCNCPVTSTALTCAPGFSKVCPMMGDMCPQDMDPICPYNAMSRMAGNAAYGGMDKGCQCVPDFLLAMVMIQPTGRMEAVDRAMTKATIQVGKKKCKCSYEMDAENCKKSKIVCDKKCSGKESGVELADGAVMYMVDIAVKKGKVTIAKCDIEAPEQTGTGGGSNGSGSGNGEGGMGGVGSRCACVSKGMGGSGPTVDGSFDSILLTGGYDNGSLALTELYPASPNCILPDLPRRRDDHVSFTTNSGLMAICGGNHESVGLIEGSGETTASCLVLNTSSMKWEKDSRIPDLPSPRYGFTSVSLPDIGVFILGGAHHNGNSSLLLRTGSSSWVPGPMIPDGVAWDACCVALKAFSFLLIGTGDYPDYHKVREYRADTETWEPVEKWPRLNKGRFGHACSIIGSKVVITGGNGTAGGPHISSTELIDLNQKTLSSGGPLNTPRVFPAMATIGHEGSKTMYVIGGRTEPWIGLDSVEKWQESTETWILDGKIAAKKQAMGVIPIKKSLVCKG